MIRIATIDDCDTITLFNTNLAQETEGIELDKETLKRGVKTTISSPDKGVYFVYEEDNQIIGQMMITNEWSDWRNGYFWWIQSVYIHQDHRKKGVFQSLYNHIKNLVEQDSSLCGLRLYVENKNETAKETYKKLGLKETYYLLYEWEDED